MGGDLDRASIALVLILLEGVRVTVMIKLGMGCYTTEWLGLVFFSELSLLPF